MLGGASSTVLPLLSETFFGWTLITRGRRFVGELRERGELAVTLEMESESNSIGLFCNVCVTSKRDESTRNARDLVVLSMCLRLIEYSQQNSTVSMTGTTFGTRALDERSDAADQTLVSTDRALSSRVPCTSSTCESLNGSGETTTS